MALVIVTTTHDRKTGEILNETVEDYTGDKTESDIYDPLVEVLYKGFKKWEKEQNQSRSNTG